MSSKKCNCCGGCCKICSEGLPVTDYEVVVSFDGITNSTVPGAPTYGGPPWACRDANGADIGMTDCGDANGYEYVLSGLICSNPTFDPFNCADPNNGDTAAPFLGSGDSSHQPIDLHDVEATCWGFREGFRCIGVGTFPATGSKFGYYATVFFFTMPDGLYLFVQINRLGIFGDDYWYVFAQISATSRITCEEYDETFAVQEWPANAGNGTGGSTCSRPLSTDYFCTPPDSVRIQIRTP